MRKMNFKKSAAVILSTVCMVTALVGCGSSSADNGADADSTLAGSITAAGSSALKPLVDDAADLFNEKYPDVNITIDAGVLVKDLSRYQREQLTLVTLMWRQQKSLMQLRQQNL